MARYKTIDTSPRFIALDLERQLLPGTFEHALNHLLDHEIDLSALDARYHNAATGASAYPPATLLKLVLFAYSQGIVSGRAIERMCCDHAVFIALSGDSQPHFATIAGFIRSLGDEIAKVFAQVLLIFDRQGLISRPRRSVPQAKSCIATASTARSAPMPAVNFLRALRSTRTLPAQPDTTKVRQVAILTRKTYQPPSHTERMRRRIDSEQGKAQYARRFATVEPVFGNLRKGHA